MQKITGARASLVALTCALTLSAHARAEDARQLNVPAGDLTAAIESLVRQSGIEVVYRGEQLKGLSTQGVHGKYLPRDALKKLIEGTSLELRTDASSGAVLISRPAPPPPKAEPVAPASSTSGNVPDGRTEQLEEIIVSAQKRSERLQDVPVPVTALSGESLIERNQVRLQDFYSRVPTLNFTMGLRGEPTLSIRGMTTNWAGNPTVGVVVDDIPYGASTANGGGFAAPDIDPSDLVRLEVLRGPQGTLYGASSLGGLLKFVTVDPSTEQIGGRVQAGVSTVRNGDEAGYNVRGAINIPLGADVAIRASGFTRSDPGYIDDPARNAQGVNSAEVSGGRIAALWRPADAVSLKFSALIQNNDRDGSPEVHRLPGLGDLEQATLRGTGKYSTDTRLYTATLAARIADMDLTVLSGYNDNAWSAVIDDTSFCGSTGSGWSDDFFGVPGCSLPEEARTKKFTQEVRLAGTAGPRTDWLLGVFYTHEKTDWFQQLLAVEPATGNSPGSILDYTFGPTTFEELAAFADLTFHITDRLDVQLGGRQSHNQQRHDETGIGPLFGGVEFPSPTIRTDADAFTYLVTPRLKLTPDVMLYARLASGYRPGGPNQLTALGPFPSAFDPDRSQNYEIGVKGDFLDRALSIDASVYSIDWKDLQINISDPGTFFNYTANASRARSRGVDLTVEAHPHTGLTVAGWIAWNDAELTEGFPVGSTSAGRSGDRLPFSSRVSGNLSLDQDFPLSSGMTAFIGGAVTYVGERKGAFTTTSDRQSLPSYAQVDVRGGVRKDSWVVNVFLSNLADRRGVLAGGVGTSNPIAFAYITPRTAGISLSRTF